MATVNKQSLREEFDHLKAEFERLCAAGTMAAESRALFQVMLMLFEVDVRVHGAAHVKKQRQLEHSAVANIERRPHPPRR